MDSNVGSGDRGMTSLLSGERVPKSDPRIEACGDLDELSSVIGALAAALPGTGGAVASELRGIQSELLNAGARCAVAPGSAAAGMLKPRTGAPLEDLERSIESMEKSLPPLRSFLLPGGCPAAAWAHVARTVCRRAERRVAAVGDPGWLLDTVTWLNRLSTYLYALARFLNAAQGIPDIQWKG
jgi:cob(I)alamin adenosyltransferase